MNIVLASASPRRKQLLEMLGVKDMRIIPACGVENPPENASAAETVMALALEKGREVAAKCGSDELIIAADTIVWLDGEIFGKPRDEAHAFDMLRRLSGRAHQVYTGVAVIKDGRELIRAEESAVFFRELDCEEIAAYIATGEPVDKAGAYAAQGLGALFVKGIEGDFFNVMGLPLCLLDSMLREFGISLLSEI